jgi:hypothetical protein
LRFEDCAHLAWSWHDFEHSRRQNVKPFAALAAAGSSCGGFAHVPSLHRAALLPAEETMSNPKTAILSAGLSVAGAARPRGAWG